MFLSSLLLLFIFNVKQVQQGSLIVGVVRFSYNQRGIVENQSAAIQT